MGRSTAGKPRLHYAQENVDCLIDQLGRLPVGQYGDFSDSEIFDGVVSSLIGIKPVFIFGDGDPVENCERLNYVNLVVKSHDAWRNKLAVARVNSFETLINLESAREVMRQNASLFRYESSWDSARIVEEVEKQTQSLVKQPEDAILRMGFLLGFAPEAVRNFAQANANRGRGSEVAEYGTGVYISGFSFGHCPEDVARDFEQSVRQVFEESGLRGFLDKREKEADAYRKVARETENAREAAEYEARLARLKDSAT
ncbi:MAG: hypothetical protein V1820_03815, partial [archaeon]